ncbi:MAG: formate dehydrogenase family accessory protein FdhD [Actinomycetia bacterium]|nr:formate dehydrogenase family accessory protein FdhD [Actinomycetes bacterium]
MSASDRDTTTPVKAVRRPATKVQVVVWDGTATRRTDEVVTEEPLQIRAQGPGQALRDVAITMRTPGHDFELAVGYLVGEGAIRSGDEVREVRYCDVDPGQPQLYNVVTVATARPLPESLFGRSAVIGASCGACGKTSIDQLHVHTEPLGPGPPVPISLLVSLPERLREGQTVFDRTGGVHAAGRFRADGTLVAVREDVGRHNAVDKLVGAAVLGGPRIDGDVLVLSGRVSFEMVQKAVVARFPIVVAVSAPSSLAVRAAEELGCTVLGFTRDGAANVYSHTDRVDLTA